MRLPSWHQIVGRFAPRIFRPRLRDRKRSDFVRLSVRRLEDRRVLSGTPVGMGVTISDAQGALLVDATQASGTNQTFDVSLQNVNGKIELELTDNGTILYEDEIANIASVEFLGAANNDTLIVDFSNGDPIPTGGISFVSAGSAQPGAPGDTLQFVNGSVSNVAYTLSGQTSGQVTISVGSQLSTVQFSGVAETVTDQLAAATRSFSIGGTVSSVQLAADAQAAGMSQLTVSGGSIVDFQNPTASLAVDADPQATTTIDVHGLDAGFSASLAVTAGPGSTVAFSAPTSLGGGNLSVSAGDIEVDSPVTTTSGTIELSATQQIVVAPTGALSTTANTISLAAPTMTMQGTITAADGGTVTLDAGVGGTLIDTGFIDASSNIAGGTGGTVNLLGTYVGLTGNAVVNVSGSAGGGTVRIGGDFHGANPAIQNASQTYVGQDVVIDADALDSGTGGNVVVWSDQVTQFYGSVDARGGAAAGDGGYVEISSLQGLAEQGLIDLSAANGQMGTLLLDPASITIGGAGSSVPPITFGTPGTNLTVSEATLENATANIVLQATNAITISNLLSTPTLALQSNVSITLQTRNDAGLGDSATGGVSLVNGNQTLSIIASGNGTITIEGGVNAFGNGVVTSHQGEADVTVAGLKTAGGNITVDASGNVNIQGNISSSGGAVSATADSAAAGAGTLTINPSVGVTTGNAALNLAGANFVMLGSGPTLGTLNSGTAATTIQASDGETIGLGTATGNISITEAELQKITSGSLIIGGSTTGNITASGVTTNGQQGGVTLTAGANGATITFGSGNDSFAALSANANGEMSVLGNVTTTGNMTTGNVTLVGGAGGTGNITLADGVTVNAFGNLTVGAANGENGLGNVTLVAGNRVLVQNALTTVGALTVTATSGSATFDSTVQAGNTFQVTAGNGITLDGNVATTGGDVVLAGGTGNITLADNVRVSAFGNLTLGATGGENGLGNLTLVAGTAVLVQNAIMTAGALTVTATTGSATFNSTVLTGTNSPLLIDAAAGITLDGNVSTTGTFTANADSSADGTGTFTLGNGVALSTGNAALSITAANFVMQGPTLGTLNSGNAATTIQASDGETIGLGTATGNITITEAELQNISSGNLTIGGNSTGNITVSSVTTNGQQGLVTLLADAANATITFQGGASTFQALSATASNSIDLNANVTATNGNVDFQSAVYLTSPITVQATSGHIEFHSTLDSNTATPEDLTLTTLTSGDILLDGAAGATHELGNLTVNSAGRFVESAGVTALSGNLTAAGNIYLNGNVTATNGAIDFQSATYLTSPLTVQATSGHIEFHSTLDSNTATPEDLTLKTLTSGDILLDGAAGATHELGNLTVNSAGRFVESQGITALSGNLTAAGNIYLNGNVTATNGALDFQSATYLTSPVTVEATSGHIEFHHTLDSNGATPEDLTLTTLTSGDILLDQAVGAAHELGNLTVNSAGRFVESAGVTALSGNLTAAGNITLNGNVTATNGAIDFQSATYLTSPLTVQATSGHIEFHSTLDSNTATPEDLTLTTTTSGDILLDGAAGATHELGNLTVTSAGQFVESAGITAQSVDGQAAGNITLNGNVTATPGNVSLTSNGTLTVNDTISTEPGTGGTLTVTGGVVINSSIDVGAGNVTLQAAGQDIIVNSGTLSAAAIDLEAPRDIIIAALVETTSPGADIILKADKNDVGVGGVWITSTGQVELRRANVVIQGSNLYGLEYSATPPSGSVIVDANVTADSIVAAGNITIQNTAFAPPSANVVLEGAVTSTGAGNINVTAENEIELDTTIKSAGGNIEFQSPVLLTSPTTVISNASATPGGNVTFDDSVDSATTTAEPLTVTAGTGNVTFTGAVGADHALGALLVTSAGEFLESAGVMATSVDVTAADNIYLNGNVTATNGNIDFRSAVYLTSPITVEATSGHIEFHSTLDSNTAAPEDLTLETLTSGDILLDGAAGATHELGNLTVNSAGRFVESAGVTALSGNLTAAGNITLNGNVTATNGALDFRSATYLTSPLTVSATSGHIEFHSTLDSNTATAEALTLTTTTSGDILLDHAAGAQHALGALLVTSAGEFVETAGITAKSVDVTAANNIYLNGSVTATNGNVDFRSAVYLTGPSPNPITVSATSGHIEFHSTLNSNTATAIDLTLKTLTSGDILLDGAAGSQHALGVLLVTSAGRFVESAGVTATSVDATAANNIYLNGNVTATSGAIDFRSATYLTSPLTVQATSGHIEFHSTLDSNTATPEDLTLKTLTSGDILLDGAAGATHELGNLTVNSAGRFVESAGVTALSGNLTAANNIYLNGNVTATNGAIDFRSATYLTSPLTVQATSGHIEFHSTLDSNTATPEDLTLKTLTSGDILLDGAAGATHELGNLTVNSAGRFVESAGVTALSGNLTAANNIYLNGNVTATNGAIDFRSATYLTSPLMVKATSGHIEFHSTLDSNTTTPEALTLTTLTSGDILLDGAAGATHELGNLTVNSAGRFVESAGVTALSGNITAAGNIYLNGNVTATNGALDFQSAVYLTSPLTVEATSGHIEFHSTLDSNTATAEALTLTTTTSGDILLDHAAGAQHALGALLVTSAGEFVESAGITAKSVDVTAANNIYLNGSVTATNGNVDFRSAVYLTGPSPNPITVSATSGHIEFHSTLNSNTATAIDLTLTTLTSGDILLDGAAGSQHALGVLLVTSAGQFVERQGVTASSVNVNASTGVQVLANITTTGSGSNGDVGLAGGAGNITFSAGIKVNAFGNLTLGATGGEIGNGALTLLAGNNVLVQNAMTAAGALSVTATAGNVTFDQDVTTTGTNTPLVIDAASGITLDGNATTTGTFTANADTDDNGTGTFTVAAGKTVNSNNQALSITAADLNLNGFLNSGTATTSLHATFGESIGLGNTVIVGGFNVSGPELGRITAFELDLGDSTSGNITVDGITSTQSANIAHVVLDASGSGHKILFAGNASTFQDITGKADADITVNAALTATTGSAVNPGNVSLTSNGTLTVNQTISTPPGTGGTLKVTGGVVINAAIDVGAGNVTLHAGGSQDIIITVGDVSATTIDLEAPRDIIIAALVETTSPGADIILKADTNNDGVGGVWITSTGQVVAGANVFIQGSNLYGLEYSATPPSGSVIVDANSTSGKDSIIAAGNITIQNSAFAPPTANIVLDGAVTSTVAGNISVTSQNDIELDTTITSAGGNIEFHSPVLLTSPTTVISNANATPGGNVTFDDSVDSATTTAEDLTVTAGTGNLTFTGAVGAAHQVGNLTVTSAGKFLESAGVTALSVDVTAGNGITLDGNVTTTAGNISLAGGAGNITLANNVTVSAFGNLTMGATGGENGLGNLTLLAGNSVLVQNAMTTAGLLTVTATTGSATFDSTVQAGNTFQVMAGNGITLDGNVTTTAGNISLAGGAGNITLANNVTVSAFGNLTMGATGGENGLGNLTLMAGNSVLVQNAMTTAGLLTVTATTGSATFDSTVQAGNTFQVTAGNGITLDGNVTTTAGNVSLAGGAGNITLANNVTVSAFGNLTMGATGGENGLGNLTLLAGNSVLVQNAMTTAGLLTVTATTGSATFDSTVQAGNTFQVMAGNGITLDGNVTTTAGNISLAGGAGNITLANNVTVSAFGNLTMGATGGENGLGNLTLLAGNSVLVQNAMTTAGLLTVTATTGSATFDSTVQAGNTFQVMAGNGITLDGNVTTTAGNISLAGGAGNITLANNVTVSAFGNLTMGATGGENGLGNLTLLAGNSVLVQNAMTTAGLLTVTATSGSATFDSTVQAGNTFQVMAGNGITLDGNVTTTAGNISLAGGAGNITLANNVTVSAFGNLTMGATGGENGLGNLTLLAGNSVLVQNAMTTAGLLTVTATSGSATFDQDVTTTGTNSPMVISAGTNITLDGNVTTTGTFTAHAETTVGTGVFTIATGKTVQTGNSALLISAGDVDLQGFLNSGTATTTIEAAQGETVGLGTGSGSLQLSETELQHITSGNLVIGNATTGSITANGVTTNGQQGPVTLIAGKSGATITFGSSDNSFSVLTATANAGMSVQGNLTTTGNVTTTTGNATDGDMVLAGGTGNITFSAGVTATAFGNLTVGAAGGEIGNGALTFLAGNSVTVQNAMTAAGALSVTATTGNVTFDQDVTTTGASTPLTITAGGNVTLDGNGTTTGTFTSTAGNNTTVVGNLSAGAAISVTSTAGSVLFQSEVTTSGSYTSTAGGDTTFDGNATSTGAFSATSGGNITQVNGKTINAGASPISLSATSGNITLSHVVTTDAGNATVPSVFIGTTSGAIINGLSPSTTENITAPTLELHAATGIGSATVLETNVSTLAAVNTTSGNVAITNSVAGLLTIGTAGNETGITNTGGGFVTVINNGALTVAGAISNAGGGNVTLNNGNSTGDLTIGAHVYATGGNGNIALTAGHDLIVNAGGSGPDIESQGTGKIAGNAANVVTLAGGVLIQSGTGAITQLSPDLTNLSTPELTAQGIATVTGTVSEPGSAHYYTVVVNWSDGTTSTQTFTSGATINFVFTHFYARNPDATNASQPIPITVTAYDQSFFQNVAGVASISFVGGHQPPVTTALSETLTETIGNDFHSQSTQINTPGSGLIFIPIASIAVVVPELHYTPPNALAFTPVTPPAQLNQTQGVESLAALVESTAVDERMVTLQVLDSKGNVTDEVLVDVEALDNLPKLFRSLPDGHYKIQLQEPNDDKQRLLVDVTLRGGKVSDETEGGQDKPPTAEDVIEGSGAPAGGKLPEADGDEPTADVGSLMDGFPLLVATTDGWPAAAPVSESPASANDEVEAAGTALGTQFISPATGSSAILAGVALATYVSGGAWEDEVDAALAAMDSGTLSKAARLARRLRRPVAQNLMARLRAKKRRCKG